MPRPKKYRKINCNPNIYYFKPRGIPMYELEEAILEQDEVEALRLADFLALSHEKAASAMKISRATFGRIIEVARKKLVDAIINGKAIKISEELPMPLRRQLLCDKCKDELKTGQQKKEKNCQDCKK